MEENKNSVPAARASFTDRLAAQVSSMVKAESPNKQSIPGNAYPQYGSREFLETFVEGKVFDIYDGVASLGTLDSYVGITPIGQTSYQTLFPKLFALNFLQGAQDIPRYTFTPIIETFGGNGEFVSGPDTFNEINVEVPSSLNNRILGMMIIAQADSTINGSATMEIEVPSTGFKQTYKVNDIAKGGAVFIWNHEKQTELTVTTPNTPVPPVMNKVITLAPALLNSEFLISPTAIRNWKIKARNTTVYAYPIVMTTLLKTVFWTHFVANALPEFGDTLLAEAQGVIN